MKVLQVDTSISGEASVTRQLTAAAVARLCALHPEAQVARRDLVSDPLPHFIAGQPVDEAVLGEFLSADIVVLACPMYNLGVPSQLKAWIDRIVVVNRTFRYTAAGKSEGLAAGRRMIIALSRGGDYSASPAAAAMEHAQSYLDAMMRFIGLRPEVVVAQGVRISPDRKAAEVAAALDAMSRLQRL